MTSEQLDTFDPTLIPRSKVATLKSIRPSMKVQSGERALDKLLWMDLEMTGLNPETEVIIEVACIVTSLNFEELETFHTVVRQPQNYIDAMDDWNQKTHGESGLITKIPGGMEPAVAEKMILELIHRNFPDSKPIL
ncbi:MAG: hypothetical protein K2X47_15110, partial [Bdellovibrionales bacterium]|nr:hypothetical protein [Bdellovibrionales bacterium]